ncbi:MAG: T9SS type A sorting domain-containing protein [Bacteroidetes bacterium]|nr:T9SS type A sorting domain-containing protein [Bacteroidota bacterium]
MKKIFTLLILLSALSAYTHAQSPRAEIYNPPLPFIADNTNWGTDYVVSSTESLGRPSGVYRTTNQQVYVAVPDTNIIAGKCIVLLMSTNNGANWSVAGSISPATIIPKTKMVAKGDSVYCFFMYGTSVYTWNVVTNNLSQFTNYTNVRDFDVTISSTSSLYLICDILGNNDVRVFGSATGGTTWPNAIYLTSTGAFPRIYMSGSGDTCLINYYGVSITADTLSSAIRSVRYRESALGALSIVGSFSTPIAGGTVKDEFIGVRNFDKAWIFYTSGTTGNIDLNCIVSTDGGVTFGTPFTIGAMPSRDEYWFDAKVYNYGVDLIYYSDSLQTGNPTNQSDKLFECYALATNPSSFSTPVAFTQNPPFWSATGYIPTLIEYYDAGSDAAAIWVGLSGTSKKLFFDRYGAITRIRGGENTIADKYSLGQNYPNPFNPETKIDFTVPVNGQVIVKVYDVTGKEVMTLINKEMSKGSYSVTFDGAKLNSGVYFYKLTSGNYSETKKMILVK